MKSKRNLGWLAAADYYDEFNTPIGLLIILTSAKGLHAIVWDSDRQDARYNTLLEQLKKSKTEKTIVSAKQQLQEYFVGERHKFELPLVFNGTDFQIKAWRELLKIPYAETISYGQQATRLGDKNKARAVGMANHCNPISIIIPCHRVIGSNGQLVGFGGGLDKKAYLLKLEQTHRSTKTSGRTTKA